MMIQNMKYYNSSQSNQLKEDYSNGKSSSRESPQKSKSNQFSKNKHTEDDYGTTN